MFALFASEKFLTVFDGPHHPTAALTSFSERLHILLIGDMSQETQDDDYLQVDEAEEILERDEDHPMDSDEDQEGQEQEIVLENDSSAHFDMHKDSVFCVAQHPVHNSIVASGSGDDTAYLFDSTPALSPPLPRSYESNPQPKSERRSIDPILKLDGHTDSVNAIAFTEPKGEYVLTAGLDGKLRAWRDTTPQLTGLAWEFVAEVQEVEEINWVATCPCTKGEQQDEEKRNVVALGANDGSAWVFRIDHTDPTQPISIVQSFFQHTASCTAGAWTPDGKLLATVSEDASFYVYDVFGAAAAAGISYSAGTSAVVGMTAEDQRFAVDGGLYSVEVAPSGSFAAVGGAEGCIRVVGLPRLLLPSSSSKKTKGAAPGQAGASAAGVILASLQAQSDGIETLSFSSPPLNLLAAGSVDGSIALFDTAHRFAVRRHIRDAHEGSAVVKLEFLPAPSPSLSLPPAVGVPRLAGRTHSTTTGAPVPTQSRPWLLTSVGMDGVVRRWDARGGTAAAGQGLLKEWRGHVSLSENAEGEQSGGIMGFVQSKDGKHIVTAGDDGVVLVFEE